VSVRAQATCTKVHCNTYNCVTTTCLVLCNVCKSDVQSIKTSASTTIDYCAKRLVGYIYRGCNNIISYLDMSDFTISHNANSFMEYRPAKNYNNCNIFINFKMIQSLKHICIQFLFYYKKKTYTRCACIEAIVFLNTHTWAQTTRADKMRPIVRSIYINHDFL